MTITSSDVPRVAGAMRLAGELFEAFGADMLTATADWSNGPKAANLDPDSGGNRWENCTEPAAECCPHAKPSDPTGEAAIAEARTDFHAELQRRLRRCSEDALWIRDAAHVLAPIVPPSTMNAKDDRWCDNCLRIGLANPRHRGTDCRPCYEFRLLYKIPQPPTLIRARRSTGKVTDKMVKEALAAEGIILETVAGVTKAVRQSRGTTRNQNQKRKSA